MLRKEWILLIVGIMVIASPVVLSIRNVGAKDQIRNSLRFWTRLGEAQLERIIQKPEQDCPLVLDERIYREFLSCQTNLTTRQNGGPENLAEDFQSVCKIFPMAKSCLEPYIKIIDECWSVGDKFSAAWDSIDTFICSDATRDRIVLHGANNLTCMIEQLQQAVKCVMKSETILFPKEEDVCKLLHDCSHHQSLRNCDDPISDDLIASLLRMVINGVGCSKVAGPEISAANHGIPSNFLLLPCILVAVVYNLI